MKIAAAAQSGQERRFRRTRSSRSGGGFGMKRVVMVTLLTVVAGTASAAIFVSPPAPPDPPRAKPAKLDAAVPSGPPTTIEAHRAPVPLLHPSRPVPAEIGSFTQPPAAELQLQREPQQADNSAKAVDRDASKAARDRADGDNPCNGRSMRSVTIEPNGRVHIQC
jgi:hypothetical protein